MGAPNTSVETSEAPDPAPAHHPDATKNGVDPLADIGAVLSALKERDEQSAESTAHLLEGRQAFFDEFHEVCRTEVRPAMQTVLERLRQEGGDGLIEEFPGGEPRVSTPRLTLWLSLQGPFDDAP